MMMVSSEICGDCRVLAHNETDWLMSHCCLSLTQIPKSNQLLLKRFYFGRDLACLRFIIKGCSPDFGYLSRLMSRYLIISIFLSTFFQLINNVPFVLSMYVEYICISYFYVPFCHYIASGFFSNFLIILWKLDVDLQNITKM